MTLPACVSRLRRTCFVVLVGLAVSTLGGWAALTADRDAARRSLQAEAMLHAKVIEARFSDLEHPILSSADFVASDLDHGAGDFLRFAAFAAPHAAILRWLAWAPRVTDSDRAAFVARAQRTEPGFRILDRSAGKLGVAPQRAVYFPLYVGRDFQQRAIPLGFDIFSNELLRAAAQRASDQAQVVATAPIRGLEHGATSQVTVIVAPIYRGGSAPPPQVEARRQALAGYVAGAFSIDAVLRFVTSGVAVPHERISFGPLPPHAHLGEAIAAEREPTAPATSGPSLPPLVGGGYRVVLPLSFAGQTWDSTFDFGPQAVARHQSYAPFGWFGAGLLLTAALGTMTARREARHLATEQLVATRTQELSAVNRHLHHAAATLEATLSAAPLGIIAIDADGRITHWNRGAERIFGHPAAAVISQSYFDLVVPPAHRAEADALLDRIRHGEPLRDVDVPRRRRDGTMLDIRVAGNPLYDADGRLRGVVFANQDVTDSRRMEEQLRQAQKMEAIGQLTGGLAHDFNNLLGTAIASLDLLDDRVKDDPDEKDLVTDALDALLHGADLVRRLLAFARRCSRNSCG